MFRLQLPGGARADCQDAPRRFTMSAQKFLSFFIGFLCLALIRADLITTYAGSTATSGYAGDNAAASSATLGYPWAIACDSSGNLYIADQNNHRIRKVTASTGIISTIVGTGTSSYSGDSGLASSATLNTPLGVAYDTADNLYIADTYNQRIRKVSAGVIYTVAGSGATGSSSGSFIGENVQATSATLNQPYGIATDSSNNVYIADSFNNRIRKITVATSVIATIAGGGGTGSTSGGYNGDNISATAASLNGPVGVAVDSSGIIVSIITLLIFYLRYDIVVGNIYISDTSNNRIRKVIVSTSVITTIAGTGTSSFSGDNSAASAAALYYPQGVAVDSSGNVYISDQYNNRVRKITASTGVITTIAGTGSGSFSGDGGEATAAALYKPIGIALDSSSK